MSNLKLLINNNKNKNNNSKTSLILSIQLQLLIIMSTIILILTTTKISSIMFVFVCFKKLCRKYRFSDSNNKSIILKHSFVQKYLMLQQGIYLQQRLQQKQQQHQQTSYCLFTAIIIGLFFNRLCVNGQIYGYTAGADYPTYEVIPKGLSFNCQGRLPGYYADIETRCQVWHWCLHSGHQYSFLCPNGTVFNQAVRVCDWWTNVNCPASEQLYQNNEELYRLDETSLTENNI